jgi:hypothetical protein
MFGFGGYDVALDGNRVFVVFEQASSGIWLTRSDDGAQTFQAPVQVQGPASGGGVTIASLTVDGTGNPVVSYIRVKNEATYQVRRSPDGGDTWGDPVTANLPAPGGAVCECCSSDLWASGDSIWIVFRNNNQNLRDIWVSRSTNLAASFDEATDVDNTDWHTNTCPISGPPLARSGNDLLQVWMSQASGMARVYCSALQAGTMQSGAQIDFPNVPGPQVWQTFPEIAAAGDTVGVVFLEKSREVVFYHSTSGITGLQGTPQRFSLPNHTFQFPSLAYRNGIFHLIYTDATADKVLYRRGVLTQSSAVQEGAEARVSVSPNPSADGVFWIKSESAVLESAVVFDVLGHPLRSQIANGNPIQLDVSDFPQGLYFLQIRTTDGECLRKVWKN